MDNAPTEQPTNRGGRFRRSTGCALAVSLAAGMLSTVALVAATPGLAAAATTPVAATWSPSPNCSTYVTATPPAGHRFGHPHPPGRVEGAGYTNSGSGGTVAQRWAINGTFALTHNTGPVASSWAAVGAGGSTGGGGGASINGPTGGVGYASGAASGRAQVSRDVSVDGDSPAEAVVEGPRASVSGHRMHDDRGGGRRGRWR